MSDYLGADRCCDLVMKGGITSGVLYPPAICEIAKRFNLVGIGGTSAGAIAACAAAAAEYRRRHGDGAGYERLKALPYELAADGRLKALFRPDKPTKKLFDLFVDSMDLKEKGWFKRQAWKARVATKVVRSKKNLGRVVDNGLGLCTGMANGNRPKPGEIEPITEWLARVIDEIAGKADDPDPLTFGDLRQAPAPPGLESLRSQGRSIDLRAVTTCLSYNRPYALPLDGIYYFAFEPREWARLVPAKVLEYMVRTADEIDAPALKREGRLPFPVGDKLPVVIAARMSLAFPVLFTTVPLYVVDYHSHNQPMEKVHFSDGGITSNLPIHLFDALFPRWPTLVINLQYMDDTGQPTRRSVNTQTLVHMIRRREDGASDLLHIFDRKDSPLGKLLGFGGSIFRSAQVWHDHSFLRLPAYRDRWVEVWLDKTEGGMNLTMPEEIIERLIERGGRAGTRLVERFADAVPTESLSWEGHRWARLRSGTKGLAEYLYRFRDSVEHPMPGDTTLAELMANEDRPPCYRMSASQHAAAREAINNLLAYIRRLSEYPHCQGEDEAATRPFCGDPDPHARIGSRAGV